MLQHLDSLNFLVVLAYIHLRQALVVDLVSFVVVVVHLDTYYIHYFQLHHNMMNMDGQALLQRYSYFEEFVKDVAAVGLNNLQPQNIVVDSRSFKALDGI
jgi:hypothetical protein